MEGLTVFYIVSVCVSLFLHDVMRITYVTTVVSVIPREMTRLLTISLMASISVAQCSETSGVLNKPLRLCRLPGKPVEFAISLTETAAAEPGKYQSILAVRNVASACRAGCPNGICSPRSGSILCK